MQGSVHSFILSYEAKIRTGPKSFFYREWHKSKPMTQEQARRNYARLQRCRSVGQVRVSFVTPHVAF